MIEPKGKTSTDAGVFSCKRERERKTRERERDFESSNVKR
jgi:hypothetical protein